ncbi:MAG: sigma-70 family RNA polymerase sigma factor [Planctomycetota bacterium]|nr:sigma-70 family RNA polymerase sigma factor [Planctomycetota bacterium]
MPASLVRLIAACLAGDQEAITELVERYRSQIFGLCFRMLGHRQDAEDATQETFLRVLNNLNQWDQQRAFEPWLLAIASNRCRTALTKRARRPHLDLLVETTSTADAKQREHNALDEELTLALNQLRTEHRLAFTLFHHHGKSYLEIAETLNCPVGTAKTWVHRARRTLIRRLHTRKVIPETHHHALPRF